MGLSQIKSYYLFSVFLLLIVSTTTYSQENLKNQTHQFTNDLINETSAYLLEHAHNPVNWKPWSDTVLQEAEAQNKLIIVSIGYSSCHWCHVMAKETFEDEEVAQIMNKNFTTIKVDREERPDIDQLYMTAVQLIKGQGGWPLNVILLPNGKPLYGGTYHTKEQWINMLKKLQDLYQNSPDKASEFGDKITEGIRQLNLIDLNNDTDIATIELLEQSIENWQNNWDKQWGGNKGTQKFMLPDNLSFLLDYGLLTDNKEVLDHVQNTLDKILLGGIYDHIEGGFFRYSTDPNWKVPHFEKMLYDNAQLVGLYAKAYRVFKKETYKTAATATISFLETRMRNSSGAFYSTIDADSEGKEGAYYLWKPEQLKHLITTDYNLFCSYFNINKDAAIEDENYILFKSMSDEDFTLKYELSNDELLVLKANWIKDLKTVREIRTSPHIDEKIITSWNALMINGYVEAYRSFGTMGYLASAHQIMTFIKKQLYNNNVLSHSLVAHKKNENQFAEDFAYLIDASINLYTVSSNEQDLSFATDLTNQANNLFLDTTSSMYQYTLNNKLITPLVKTDDGVIPSPNSVMALNLLKIGHLLYNVDYLDQASTMLKSIQPQLLESPSNYSVWGSILLKKIYPYYEVAIVGDKTAEYIQTLNSNYIPNTLIIGSKKKSELPIFKDRYAKNETYIYVCQNSTCKLPVTTPEEAFKQIH